MIKTLILFGVIFFISSYELRASCEIETSEKILINKKSEKMNPLEVIKSTDCSGEIIKSFYLFIKSAKGKVLASHVENILQSEHSKKIKIKPEKISIATLSDVLIENFKLNKNWSLSEINFTGKDLGAILLDEDHIMDVDCRNCDQTGEKNLKITVREPLSGRKMIKWLRVKIAVKTTVYVSQNHLSVNNQSLNKSLFKEKIIETDVPEKFFKDSNFTHYKLNKNIKKGETLELTDIHPLNLVKMGELTKVKLNSKGIQLERKAKPLNSGKLGEMIKLRNPNNHKIISGKVTDFNQVTVEL